MSKYDITCYCSACNSPKQSRKTASGELATEGITVAVHPSKYKKNQKINIEGIGERKIQDKHGSKNENLIDVYVGEYEECECSKNSFSGLKCKVTFY